MHEHRRQLGGSCVGAVDFVDEGSGAGGYLGLPMSPEDIKALRQELGCTARELASALGLEQQTVLAWERGELFPTKRYCEAMEALRAKGPGAIPKKTKRKAVTPMAALADPEVWRIVRKVIAHAELRAAVAKMAEGYADPADGEG